MDEFYRLPDERLKPRRSWTDFVAPLVMVGVAGFLLAKWMDAGPWRPRHDPDATPRPVAPRGDLAHDEQSTINLFRTASPSVVYITTTVVRRNPFSFDETTMSRGTGSGFIWDTQGHVVTNDHVIAASNRASVTLADQSVWPAELIGRTSEKDLAVLRIDAPASQLQPLLLGRSNDLQVGQKVFAIGNPFGLDRTLTTGVISAVDRQITTSELPGRFEVKRTIHGVIQTDAAINPGNSGGPLLDSAGRLIGVNTAIFSPSGAYAGVGFAIPVDTVNRIVPQLIRHGKVIRPGLGIEPFSDQTTRQLGLEGVLIKLITPNSPADEAGLQPTDISEVLVYRQLRLQIRFGDLIVAADGVPIHTLDDYYSFLEQHKTGDRVTLTVRRGLHTPRERNVEVEVTLGPPSLQ